MKYLLTKRILLISCLVLVISGTLVGNVCRAGIPKNDCVPDQATAISIAEAVWIPVYGKDVIHKEKPYLATLSKGVWTVMGTFPKGYDHGGVAFIEIVKKDGRILIVTHGK